MASPRSGCQHQHNRGRKSWIKPRGGARRRLLFEDPLRWLPAQEIARKLQSPAMPFPKMPRVAAQDRPYLDWRWTGPSPCGRSPPGALEGGGAEVSQEKNLHKDHQRQRAHKFAKENLSAIHYCREGKLRQY